MLSEEEVRLGYRFFLGREPESEAAIAAHRRHADLATFRRVLVASREFRTKMLGGQRRLGEQARSEAPMPTGEADPAQLARLFERLRGEWTKLGESEPYWSVLTNDIFRKDRIAEHREAFFASGASQVTLLQAALRRHGLVLPEGAEGLEIGCGVGRVTLHLAPLLAHLHALDISPGNLAEAEAALAACGVGNVTLHRVSGVEDYDSLPEFDLFLSVIVLQHSPPPVARRVLERVAARGRPGAIASFQIVTYGDRYAFEIESYLRSRPAGMEVHALAQSAVFEVLREAGWRVLEVMEDNAPGAPQWMSQHFLARRG